MMLLLSATSPSSHSSPPSLPPSLPSLPCHQHSSFSASKHQLQARNFIRPHPRSPLTFGNKLSCYLDSRGPVTASDSNRARPTAN
eukprot:754755-Hanusia_phi.AAC.1